MSRRPRTNAWPRPEDTHACLHFVCKDADIVNRLVYNTASPIHRPFSQEWTDDPGLIVELYKNPRPHHPQYRYTMLDLTVDQVVEVVDEAGPLTFMYIMSILYRSGYRTRLNCPLQILFLCAAVRSVENTLRERHMLEFWTKDRLFNALFWKHVSLSGLELERIPPLEEEEVPAPEPVSDSNNANASTQ